MNDKLVEYIKSSFLKDLLINDNVTDISFNGENIYYQDNIKGRLKFDYKLTNQKAYEFIRQIANLSDSQFSYQKPILDISVDKFRINATHFSIAHKNREQCINFSIRKGCLSLRINDENEDFINKKCSKLIELFLNNGLSIIIGGLTSSGKTELQKYIISKLRANTRIIIIDNVEELETDDFLKNIDSQTWLIRNNLDISFEALIRNALRNNPDFLIVSEARGKEMLSILNSAMTGHPTISTIHSKSCPFMYRRMARMCLQNGENLKYKEVLEDIYDHFKIVIYVKKIINEKGNIVRYCDKIGTNYHNRYYELYSYPNIFNSFPPDFDEILKLDKTELEALNKWWVNKEIINEKYKINEIKKE